MANIGDLTVELKGDAKGLEKSLKTASDRLKATGDKMKGIGKKMKWK